MNISARQSSALPVNSRAAGRPARRAWNAFGLTLPALAFLGALFVFPLVRLFGLSIQHGNLASYAQIADGTLYFDIFRQTFSMAGIVTIASLALGYPVAYFLATTTPFWRKVGFSFVVLPLWVSVLVRTYAWMIILGRNGIINRALLGTGLIDAPLALLNTPVAVAVGMIHVMLPYMILPIYAAFARIDHDLPRAACGLGASDLRVFLEVTFPLTIRGVATGMLLVFVVSLGFFITPALLGGGKFSMIAMVIEQQVREFLAWDFAGALAVMLLLATLAIVGIFNGVVSRYIKA